MQLFFQKFFEKTSKVSFNSRNYQKRQSFKSKNNAEVSRFQNIELHNLF